MHLNYEKILPIKITILKGHYQGSVGFELTLADLRQNYNNLGNLYEACLLLIVIHANLLGF